MARRKFDSGFVYIWFDRKRKRYYIGSHWGSPDDGYICSSRWMRKAYNRRPFDFKRRIISFISTNRQDLLYEEGKWLSFIKDDELGKRYYNRTKMIYHWHTDPNKADNIIQQMRVTRKGKPSPMKGKHFSEESKKNMGGQNKGKTASQETKDKRSASLKGMKWYTDGIHDCRVRDGEPIPDGYKRGRTKGLDNLSLLADRWSDPEYREHQRNVHKGRRWFTDGVVDLSLGEGDNIPDGFKLGRTNGMELIDLWEIPAYRQHMRGAHKKKAA